MKLQQEFLRDIANKVFGDSLSEEKACFLRRFDPQYHPENVTDKQFQTNKHIAELINKDLPAGYCGHDKIGLTIRQTIKAISGKYKEEMEKDQVKTDALFACEQGGKLKSAEGEDSGQKFSPWQKVYHWLWQHKYPRWLEANSWELLREKATSTANWMRFLTEEMADLGRFRGPYLEDEEPEPEITPIIPVNEKLWIAIDLEYPNCQFLLFNRSEEGVVLLCPSFGYAPNPIIDKPPLLLPQKDSFAKEQKFLFKRKGQEEFLGIVLNNPLNLPWLIPQRQEKIPEWNGKRIMDLFNHLEQSGEWQVFYQSFEVVESETKADNVDNG